MYRILIILYLSIISFPLLGQENRLSNVSYEYEFNADDYQGHSIYASIGISSKSSLQLDLYKATDQGDYENQEIGLGIDHRFTENFASNMKLLKSEESDDISGVGLATGARYNLNNLWNSEAFTTLSWNFRGIRYGQEETTQISTNRIRTSTVYLFQFSNSLSFSHEWGEYLLTGLTYSKYSYDDGVAFENSVVSPGSINDVSTKPDYSYGAYAALIYFTFLEIEIGYYKSLSKMVQYDATTWEYLLTGYIAKNWSLSGGFKRYETSSSQFDSYQAGVTFSF